MANHILAWVAAVASSVAAAPVALRIGSTIKQRLCPGQLVVELYHKDANYYGVRLNNQGRSLLNADGHLDVQITFSPNVRWTIPITHTITSLADMEPQHGPQFAKVMRWSDSKLQHRDAHTVGFNVATALHHGVPMDMGTLELVWSDGSVEASWVAFQNGKPTGKPMPVPMK